jgi:magnesium-transporting ATPase (P-type)
MTRRFILIRLFFIIGLLSTAILGYRTLDQFEYIIFLISIVFIAIGLELFLRVLNAMVVSMSELKKRHDVEIDKKS